jgi:hypothetical protein
MCQYKNFTLVHTVTSTHQYVPVCTCLVHSNEPIAEIQVLQKCICWVNGQEVKPAVLLHAIRLT